jgi:hypothetical protein
LATILPSIKQEILRDREEEMVHRGAQYTRAIRLYYRKTGHYPAKIEDLESTNNLRFLRKRYKDPTMKGEDSGEADFKVLRYGDPGVRLQQAGLPQVVPSQSGADGNTVNQTVARIGQAPSDPNANADDTNAPAEDANGNPIANPGQNQGSAGPADGEKPVAKPENPTYGGGAMVGVTSTNRNTSQLYAPTFSSIREFNKKHHYNQWQFIYDPATDRGGLPTGPWQPLPMVGSPGIGQPVQPANQPGPENPTSEPIHDPQQ